jgi:dipeptidyl-peptidase 4
VKRVLLWLVISATIAVGQQGPQPALELRSSGQQTEPTANSFFTQPSATASTQAATPQAPSKQLTIESIFTEGGITGRGPETIKWSPDGTKVSFVQRDDSGERGALYYVDVASGKREVLVSEQKLATLAPPISSIKDEREKERIQRYSVAGYQWAPDSKHLLFDAQGQLWLYSLDNGTAVQLTSSPDPSSDPKFSPDGKRLAFVRKHNLFVHDLKANREKQLTNDKSDDVLNGEVDWVYAEELDVRSNYYWSPEGRIIAFLQMNEKQVPAYPITDFMAVHAKVDGQKYPQPGDANPAVRVGVVDAGSGKVKWIELPDQSQYEYIPRFGWVHEGMLWLEEINRAQNRLDLYFVDVNSGRAHMMLSETSDTWVEVNDDFQVLASGDRFTWSSWRDGHTHLYLYSFDKNNPLGSDAKLEHQVTKGDFEVTSLEGVDEKAGTAYVAANADNPLDRQIYAAKLDGSGMTRISKGEGSHHATFSDGNVYYVDDFSTETMPPKFSLCRASGGCSTAFWEARSVAAYKLHEPKVVQLKSADGKTTLYGTLWMPANPEGKVPLILNPYGGPGVQDVRDDWNPRELFNEILLRDGFAVLTVDNRGMAGRGKQFAAAAFGKFGPDQLADQIAALDQTLAANPQLDGSRVGLWGWSFGGYFTLYAMTHSNRFAAGVAVAPVTNWLLYDSIYTERYLGVPSRNPRGYEESSPVHDAAMLHGRLLEVHGTSDDNVHPQNTIQMVNALINAGKPFDLMLYPDKTHGIAGTAARAHLFHGIEDHFRLYLLGEKPAEESGSAAR